MTMQTDGKVMSNGLQGHIVIRTLFFFRELFELDFYAHTLVFVMKESMKRLLRDKAARVIDDARLVYSSDVTDIYCPPNTCFVSPKILSLSGGSLSLRGGDAVAIAQGEYTLLFLHHYC